MNLAAVELTLVTTNVTMPSNRTFQMPLTGSDPLGSPLTFSVVSISDIHVTGSIAPGGNRSLALNISGVDATNGPFSGDLVLQLYEDIVPLTTARIIQLTETNFYDGLTFHRVIQNFVAQGGDPSGNGTGGTGVKFDDEFVASLTFTGFGQLAMANSGDDSNDSQFFITDVDLSVGDPSRLPPRHLDFNHTIFGQVTRGFDVLTKIIETPVNGSSAPLTPVVINSAIIFADSQDAVLRLAASAGFTGTVDVTVSAMNTNSESATQTFHVTVVSNTVNSAAFLGPIPSGLITTQNTAVSFFFTSTDIDNDAMSRSIIDATTGQFPAHLASAFINPSTSFMTLVPDMTFTGVMNLVIRVTDGLHALDTQHLLLTVKPCSYSLDAAGDSFPTNGGNGSVTVSTAGGCNWTVTNTNSWIDITDGGSGSGNNTVQYTVAPNANAIARNGPLVIAGQMYTVSQDGVMCSYSLNSSGTNHTAAAGPGSFGVITPGGCDWSANTTDTWIHTTSTGPGSGTVNYTVDPNPDFTARAGAIAVQGHIFMVNQESVPCSYAIATTNVSVAAAATNGAVDVITSSLCDWTAMSNDSWITIDAGAGGTGNGTVGYSVDVNPGIVQRTGTVSIASRTFTVMQAANVADFGRVLGAWDVTLVSSLKISKLVSGTRTSPGHCKLFPEGDFELLEDQYGPTAVATGAYSPDVKGKKVLFVVSPDGQASLRLFLLAWLSELTTANGLSVENADLSIVTLKVGKTKIAVDGQLGTAKLSIKGLFTGMVAGIPQTSKYSCSMVLTFGQKHDL